MLMLPLAANAQQSINVAAASSLRVIWPELEQAMPDSLRRFRHRTSFASTGLLTQQLLHGAPFDVFLAADQISIDRLADAGLTQSEGRNYAAGQLVAAVSADVKLDGVLSMETIVRYLQSHPAARIAMANPRHAPYGKAAQAVLEHHALWPRPAANVLLGENAAQAFQFARTGAVDVALLPKSLVLATTSQLQFTDIDAEQFDPVVHQLVIMRGAGNGSQQLSDWLLSPAAQAVFARSGFYPGSTMTAFWLSIQLAAWTTCLLLPIGLLLGRWLAFTQVRGKFWIEALLLLPLVLPPTVIGYYLLQTFSPTASLGQIWLQWFGSPLVFSFTGLVMASLLINIPFAIQPVQLAYSSLPDDMREAAWVSGLSPLRTWWHIELPLTWSGLLGSAALVFAHTLGEFGVVLMVGGNIEGVTRTMSIAIYDSVQAFDMQTAGRYSLALLLFSLCALAAVRSGSQRR